MATGTSTILVLVVDGREYKIEISSTSNIGMTPREWGVMKRIASVPGPAAFMDALMAYDVEAVAALAIVAMRRAGQPVDEDKMLDGLYTLELRFDGADDAADPPVEEGEVAALTSRPSRTSKTPARTGRPS